MAAAGAIGTGRWKAINISQILLMILAVPVAYLLLFLLLLLEKGLPPPAPRLRSVSAGEAAVDDGGPAPPDVFLAGPAQLADHPDVAGGQRRAS